MNLGVYLMSLATVVTGVLDLIWRDFDPSHQPFGGIDYYIPDRTVFACIAGVWLIFAGSALPWKATARLGSFATAAIYCVFGLLSLPHFYTMLHKYGFHLTLIIGVTGQVFLQLMVAAGCLLLEPPDNPVKPSWSENSESIGRWTFGIGGILTGIGHLINTRGLVHMIPRWMPFAPSTWILISGVGFILAGVAILTGIVNLLATRLLALMLFIFEIILVPLIFEFPHVHQAWGGTAFNLATAGSVCIFAASLARHKMQHKHRVHAEVREA